MGEVYRARDTKLDRDVAVKVLPAAVANDPDTLARFEREAKAVAALSHPNILAIHDFGRHDGVAYAVTELLEGETLRGKLDSGPVSVKQATDYGLQITRGLAAAHERGIVHRDLKPDNVFVTKDRHVKILDFGLAKRVESAMPGQETSAPTGSGHTEPGHVMGTMGYMSPEQVRGLPVDHRSDIFSFGALLYELLCGQKAFKRNTASDTIVAILKEEPPELTGSGRNIAPALDHVVRHCLEKEPGNRFQSAKDVTFALSEASGSSTLTGGVQVVVTPPKGRKGLLVAAGLVVVAAALGLFLLRRPQNASGAAGGVKRIAVLPFENQGLPDDDYFADGISDEIRGKLTALPNVQVIARGSSTPYRKTTKSPRAIADELDVQYLLTATVRWSKVGEGKRVLVSPELIEASGSGPPTSKWQQTFDAPVTDVFQVQSDIASRTAQALGVALGAAVEKQLAERPTRSLPAYEAFLKGVEIGASKADAASLRRELALYEQAVALDPSFAQAWAALAVTNAMLYTNSTPSSEVAERARFAAEKAMALAPKDPESYRAMGFYKRAVLGDSKAAIVELEKGLRIAPGNVNLLRNLAAAETHLGRLDAALAHAKEVERLDPRSAANHIQIGMTLLILRRYPEARVAFDSALALAPDDLHALSYRLWTWLGEGNLAAAQADVATASKTIDPTQVVAVVAFFELGWILNDDQREILLRLTPAAFDGDRGTWGNALAEAFWLKGDVSEARKHAEEARKAFEAQLLEAPDAHWLRGSLGVALAYSGRSAEAVREGQRAVELVPVETNTFAGPSMIFYLARIYLLAGEPEKAIDSLERALAAPLYVSGATLAIDPNFAPLRGNPRFQKLVAGAK
jgi:TolB-like protein/Flp pilus assembly protein TadD